MIESFATTPLQGVIPSYLYLEYSDDDDLQAFVASQNALAQGYLDWFNATPLALYTSASINGLLLDWIGRGIYGIERPTLSTESTSYAAGYNAAPYNTTAYNTGAVTKGGSSVIANDDIYKRVMTWNMYRGDGQMFTVGWLKNRINRFLLGANGADALVLDNPPSISVAGTVFTVTADASDAYSALQLCYANDALSFPFQYTLAFNTLYFVDDDGVLQMVQVFGYPLVPDGLADGAIWFNGGTLAIIPGITPDPSAPAVYFDDITPSSLLTLGGGNLPTANPSNSGQLWNNGGTICVS